MSNKLSEVQLECLLILNMKGEWLLTREIGEVFGYVLIPLVKYALNDQDDEEYMVEETENDRRDNFIANQLGPILSYLKRQGYIIGERTGNRRWGSSSRWRLGPRSDELKEQGILTDE